MSSGSYVPLLVKRVEIPKADSGRRALGIPTVTDWIAQTVVLGRLKPVLDRRFDPDSYGYRPGKSTIYVVRTARERCWHYGWVLDLDMKVFIITDHLTWSLAHIIQAYRTFSTIEETFKKMKNVRFLRWQPTHHWTDQKLRVHAFYCVLVLLVSSLAHKEVRHVGIEISLPSLLKELSAIRQVALLYPPASGAKSHITLTRMSSQQKKIHRDSPDSGPHRRGAINSLSQLHHSFKALDQIIIPN